MIQRFWSRFRKKTPRPIRAVLFDLDGTLLQVSMEKFIPAYIRGLGAHLEDLVPMDRFAEVARLAVDRLFISPAEDSTNEEHFLETIEAGTGIPPELYRQRLQNYCGNGMAALAPLIEEAPLGREVVELCHRRGLPVVLATNPVFPASVIEARVQWGALDGLPFHSVTSYENSFFCKPDPRYYQKIADELGVAAGECLMVGNDTRFDLGAKEAGMQTYLVDTYLVDRAPASWRPDFRGNHEALLDFVREMPLGPRTNDATN